MQQLMLCQMGSNYKFMVEAITYIQAQHDDVQPSEKVLVPGAITRVTESFFNQKTSPMANQKQADLHGDRPYEYRKQQAQMAYAVAEAFEKREHLCVEAPTGVGKSFAYLIPSIYHALETGLPSVICTETIALQEQLIEKDIPFLQSLLTQLPFKAVLAKGRGNYLCKKRLNMCCTDKNLQIDGLGQEDFDRITNWARQTQEGTLSAYPGVMPNDALWQSINSESSVCSYPKCGHASQCFYWRARKQWASAQLIVANHALLFTDFKLKAEGACEPLLPRYGVLIVDEAHCLEDGAANHMGLNLYEAAIHGAIRRLFDAKSGRGILQNCTGEAVLKTRKMLDQLHLTTNTFFDALRQMYVAKSESDEGSFVETEMRLFHPIGGLDHLSEPLRIVVEKLLDFLKLQREDLSDDFYNEAMSQATRLGIIGETLYAFTHQTEDDHVYWLSKSLQSKNISLHSAPLNVSENLDTFLFDLELPPTLLTSATLTVSQQFSYFKKRVGFTGKCLQIEPLFDYQNQLELHIPREMPDPSTPAYEKALPDFIKHYLQKTDGGAFVLFTAYGLMRRVFAQLEPFFNLNHYDAMMQGNGMTRSQMLRSFKEGNHGVIFGTSSFWTGVDVPGSALRNVMITKLPFPVPNTPIVQSRGERIELGGGHSFRDYSLPEAVIKLRQGAGRLIRTQTDKGILVILDSRVLTKSYGAIFIKSLPESPIFRSL